MSHDLADILERNIALSDEIMTLVAEMLAIVRASGKVAIKPLQDLTGIFSKTQRTQTVAINARRQLAKDMKAFFDKVSDAEKVSVIVEFFTLMKHDQRMNLLEKLQQVQG